MSETLTENRVREIIEKYLNEKLDNIVKKYSQEREIPEKLSLLERAIRVEEELKTQRDLMEKSFELIEKRFEQVDKRFEQVEKRFEQVDKRFEQIEKRFEQVDKRFEQIEKRFEQVDKRFELIEKHFEQVDKRFDLVDKGIDELRNYTDKRFKLLTQIMISINIPILIGIIGLLIKSFF